MKFSTVDEFRLSARSDSGPPPGLSRELQALWLTEAGRWDEAHSVAQDIHTPTGSWIHALLHLIEGDLGNAGYWYARAGRSPRKPSEIPAEWERISRSLLEDSQSE